MVYYGKSIIGKSHIAKNIPCQDNSKIVKLDNGWVIAVVCDGVGSSLHSEVASDMASQVAVDTISSSITEETKIEDVVELIKLAYKYAQEKIEEHAASLEDNIENYDTTMSLVVYDGANFAFGHSGDGGIIALRKDGEFVKVTKPQKGEDNVCVIPLRGGEASWEFAYCEGEYAGLLLATDGMYDTFFPYLLKNSEQDMYIKLVRYFIDNNVLKANQENIDEVSENRLNFINSDFYNAVNDDKTLLCIVNDEVTPEIKEEEYYKEPDWDKLQEEWNKKAYPHLYK